MRRAYTLIELLIVVGILGLAGALLVPVIGDRGDFDTQAAVQRLVADITFAQSDALANQEHRRLVFLPDTENEGRYRGWCIVKLGESQLGTDFDANTAVYVTDPLASGTASSQCIVDLLADSRFGGAFIASADLDGGQVFLTFDELGGTVTSAGQPGTGGTIVLRGGSTSYRITIDAITGKVSIADITNDAGELQTGTPLVPTGG